jgi:hypothetical protein
MRFHSSGLAFATSGRPTSTCTGWYILHHHLVCLASPLLHTPAGTYCNTIWHVQPVHFYMHQLVHIVPPFGMSSRPTSTYTSWYILYHHLAHLAGPLLHASAGAYCTTIWHIWPAHFYMHWLVPIVQSFGTSIPVLHTVLTELCEVPQTNCLVI